MVARRYHKTKIQMGGGNHHPSKKSKPKSMFKEAKTSKKYTFGQKLKSSSHGAMARTVGAYQGLSTALLGTAKRGSEWLTRGVLLSSAQRNAKKAQHAINVELGLRNKGVFGSYSKSNKLKSLNKYKKMETELANIQEKIKGNKYTKTQNITAAVKRSDFIKKQITQAQGKDKYKDLFTQDNEHGNKKVQTKEQLRKNLESKLTLTEGDKIAADIIAGNSTGVLSTGLFGKPSTKPTSFSKPLIEHMAKSARLTQKQEALKAAQGKIAERKLLLAKSGEEFKRLGSNVGKSYKQGKKDYYNARREYEEFRKKHTKTGFVAAPFALGAYLAYKSVARPLVDLGRELLDTKAGRALSREVSKKTLRTDAIGLGQTIIAHQEKAANLGSKINTLKTNIATNLATLQTDSSLKTNATELSTQLNTIDTSRLQINSLRQQIKQTTNPDEKAKLFEDIKQNAESIKLGKVKLAELRQSLLAEQATSPETVNKIISNFDNAYALLTRRNKYLDLGYNAERAIVSKAAKGRKFLEEAGPATKEEIKEKLSNLDISEYKTSITDNEFPEISAAFESVKQQMRESGSIGQAKKEWGNTYRYLNALLSDYGSKNLVPNQQSNSQSPRPRAATLG